jgi:hypothetical protein
MLSPTRFFVFVGLCETVFHGISVLGVGHLERPLPFLTLCMHRVVLFCFCFCFFGVVFEMFLTPHVLSRILPHSTDNSVVNVVFNFLDCQKLDSDHSYVTSIPAIACKATDGSDAEYKSILPIVYILLGVVVAG